MVPTVPAVPAGPPGPAVSTGAGSDMRAIIAGPVRYIVNQVNRKTG
jgi:hypothetical protein